MWLFAMFDLPTKTNDERRRYTRFRKALLQDGFDMIQYSVYARYCPSEDASRVHRKRVKRALPPAGQVRLIAITDRQFGKMDIFYGRKREKAEEPPPQLMLF